jgi:lipoprotein-releasing system permease protein
MNISLYLAKKFLQSGRKEKYFNSVSLITISGIAIGVTVVLLALAILDGFENVVSEKIAEFNSHIKVVGFGNRSLPNPEFVIEQLKKNFKEKIKTVEPFSSKLAILKSKHNTDGINLTGITTSFAVSSFSKFIIEGNYNLTNQQNILIGKYLAQRLLIKCGDKITAFCLHRNQIPSHDNPPAIEQFIVVGIYETGISEYDDGNAFINLQKAKNVFGMEKEVSGFNIDVRDINQTIKVAEELQDYLGYPFFVRTINQIHQNIFTWIELQKKPIPIVLGLIIIVAVFNIIGTMLMIVLERMNHIGVLKSFGTKRKTILWSFIYQSSYIIFWGLFIGIVISIILSVLQKEFNIISLPEKIYFVTSVPISIDLKNYLIVSFITVVVSLASSFIPALIASKIKPLSAIRFD